MTCYWFEKTNRGYRPCFVQPNGLERRCLPRHLTNWRNHAPPLSVGIGHGPGDVMRTPADEPASRS
jgi:hypothetical protein